MFGAPIRYPVGGFGGTIRGTTKHETLVWRSIDRIVIPADRYAVLETLNTAASPKRPSTSSPPPRAVSPLHSRPPKSSSSRSLLMCPRPDTIQVCWHPGVSSVPDVIVGLICRLLGPQRRSAASLSPITGGTWGDYAQKKDRPFLECTRSPPADRR